MSPITDKRLSWNKTCQNFSVRFIKNKDEFSIG